MTKLELTGEVPSATLCEEYLNSLVHYWHPVLLISDLKEKEIKRSTLLGQPIAIAIISGEVRAFRDVCSHFLASLSDGTIEISTQNSENPVVRWCGGRATLKDGTVCKYLEYEEWKKLEEIK
jgi:hypothetical protein